VSKVVQEKFQTNQVMRPEPSHEWASDASARTRKGLQQRHDDGKYQTYRADLNQLPPGMDIEHQSVREINPMRTVTAGTDDVTDNPVGRDFREGYVPLKLRSTDDMYSREHHDAFYDEITVDGITGYLERNNTLDRS
jgi:hypothetical protein